MRVLVSCAGQHSLTRCFQATPLTLAMPRPMLQAVSIMNDYCGNVVPIKKVLLWLEMARQELDEPTSFIPLPAWDKVLRDLSS